MKIKFPYGTCEKPVANNHQANGFKCGLWIHIKCSKINKQTYIYLMHENSHWCCMVCTKTFLPYSVLNEKEFKQTVIGKQVKFTHIAKLASLILRTTLKLLILKTALLNTLQSKIWILLPMTLPTLFPCFTWTLTRCHFTLMNWKTSYQSQKMTFK